MANSLDGKLSICPNDAITLNFPSGCSTLLEFKYFSIVLAFAKDSTMTRFDKFVIVFYYLSDRLYN